MGGWEDCRRRPLSTPFRFISEPDARASAVRIQPFDRAEGLDRADRFFQ